MGGALAFVLFACLLTAGRLDLTRPQWFGDFYDAQAHSLLDGRWDVPPEVLAVEAFEVEGRSYMYFGPTPALVRLPVAALSDAYDGRLTQLSMLLAFAVAVVGSGRLLWRARVLLRPDRPLGRTELAGVATTTFLVGGGTTVLYLAGRAYVYHEALLWGVALSLVAYDAIAGWTLHPTRRRLALACLLATLALLSRASVGAGPVAALGLLAAGAALRWVRRQGGPRAAVSAAAAAVVPLFAYAAVNRAKFGSLFRVPFDDQAISRMVPARQALLAENGGTLFGLKYVPSTLLAYLRPDALRFDGLFPYFSFPGPATVLGGVTFDALDYAASLPATEPAFVVLAVAGAVAVARTPALAPFRAPAAGAAVAFGVTATIGYVAQRYLADALPLVVLCAAVGVQLLARALEGRRRWARAALGGLLLLGLWGVAVNGALGLGYQRLWSPNVDDDLRAGMIGMQQALASSDPTVRRGDDLPAAGRRGDLFVVGDCDGLYFHDGSGWTGVERTPTVGYHRLRWTPGGDGVLLRQGDTTVEVQNGTFLSSAGRGRPQDIAPGRVHDLDLIADRRLGFLTVVLDGRRVLETYWAPDGDAFRLGADVEPRPFRPSLCRQLVR